MKTKGTIFTMIVALIEKVYSFLVGRSDTHSTARRWERGNLTTHNSFDSDRNLFHCKDKTLPIRMFPDMIKALTGKKENKDSLSTFQTLIVSTATRVGMGNLVGVVAAISVGGAGAVFWMWITAL